MHNRELQQQLQAISDLIAKARTACGNDLEMYSHWAKYLCVRSAGFLENALLEVYSDFARVSAQQPVAEYVGKTLAKINNADTGKFLETARRFNPAWADELATFLDENGRGPAINSIVSNRHRIAHGLSSNITVVQVRIYLDKAVEVIEFMEEQCRR